MFGFNRTPPSKTGGCHLLTRVSWYVALNPPLQLTPTGLSVQQEPMSVVWCRHVRHPTTHLEGQGAQNLTTMLPELMIHGEITKRSDQGKRFQNEISAALSQISQYDVSESKGR